ncbi:MAG: hypothetical protein P4L43_20965 [Syntrophobacteraceae bacterium]|nr:hypothetical protein [Syntrophobacteraceae bacterium]
MMAKIVCKGLLFFALALLLCSSGAIARAGGSFSFTDDLLPILREQPLIATWLTASLDFDDTGDAVRIGENVMPQFGGQRIGPYVILAKPKGASGPFTMEVTVETEMVCKNKSGQVVDDCSKAGAMEQNFTSVTVKPHKEGQ